MMIWVSVWVVFFGGKRRKWWWSVTASRSVSRGMCVDGYMRQNACHPFARRFPSNGVVYIHNLNLFFFCSFQCHRKLSFADVLFLRSPSEIVIHPSKESDLLPAVLVHKSHLLYLHISSRDSQINTPLIVLILITTPLSLIFLSTLLQSSEVDAIQPTWY